MLSEHTTVLILAFNEKDNIRRTLEALQWVPRIIVIDSFSTDGTPELARDYQPKVRVIQREFDSFARQCNFGLTHILSEWVFSIDADYLCTAELAEEIQCLEEEPEVSGYSVGFNYCVHGRRLRTTIYPARTVLYRRERAEYRDEGHGHRVHISGAVTRLASRIDHDDRKPLTRWIASQDRYTKVEARHLLSLSAKQLSAQDRLRLRLIAPVVMLFYLLLVRRLLFGGWPAWYYVCQRVIAEMLLSLRLITERYSLEEAGRQPQN